MAVAGALGIGYVNSDKIFRLLECGERKGACVELSDIFKFKEGNRLEVKAAQGGLPGSLWETISAFANTAGGCIVLGVKEHSDSTLEVIGLSNAYKMLDDFWNAALSKDKLSARFLQDSDARIESLDGREVIVIDVPRVSRLMRPVFLKKDILGETWRRTHTGDHRCTREEVQSMLRDAEVESYDARVVERAKMSDINSETVVRYRRRFASKNVGHVWNDASDEDFLQFLGAAEEDAEGVLRPTVAGLLMFGRDDRITQAFPNYFLDYRQETSADERWEDRFVSFSGDWSGNIYDFYFRVYNKLKAALKVPFKLDGIDRVDDTPAHEALREVIVNCVTNANFHERRGIVCVWRDDALTVENPGDFRIPVEEAMKPGKSDPRNVAMLKMFAMVDAGERAGSGISKILHGWSEAGYAAPSYSEEYGPDRTVLVLPLVSESADKNRQIKSADLIPVRPGKTNANKHKILEYLTINGPSKSADIAGSVDLSVSRANELLAELIAEGAVVREGQARSSRYKLS